MESNQQTPLALMKAAQVARMLGCSVRQISNMKEQLGAVKIGKAGMRFDPRKIQEFIDRGGARG